MPIYEYRCPDCGKLGENMCSIADCENPLAVICDRMESNTCQLDRILSATPTNFTFADKSAHKQSK